jgi:hypothetical protein
VRRPAAQGRPDRNHAEVKGWYEKLYCSVVDTHEVGGGFGDLVVGIAGHTDIVEVKTESGHLEPAQVTFHRDWRGSKVVIVRTQADVINHVQNVRERVSRGSK